MFSFIFKLRGREGGGGRLRACIPGLHVKIRWGPCWFDPNLPILVMDFQGGTGSHSTRGRWLPAGTGIPWDCADYSNSPNKQGPINHHIVKSCTQRCGTFVILSWRVCVSAIMYVCAHVFHVTAHAYVLAYAILLVYIYMCIYTLFPDIILAAFDSIPSTRWVIVRDAEGAKGQLPPGHSEPSCRLNQSEAVQWSVPKLTAVKPWRLGRWGEWWINPPRPWSRGSSGYRT